MSGGGRQSPDQAGADAQVDPAARPPPTTRATLDGCILLTCTGVWDSTLDGTSRKRGDLPGVVALDARLVGWCSLAVDSAQRIPSNSHVVGRAGPADGMSVG